MRLGRKKTFEQAFGQKSRDGEEDCRPEVDPDLTLARAFLPWVPGPFPRKSLPRTTGQVAPGEGRRKSPSGLLPGRSCPRPGVALWLGEAASCRGEGGGGRCNRGVSDLPVVTIGMCSAMSRIRVTQVPLQYSGFPPLARFTEALARSWRRHRTNIFPLSSHSRKPDRSRPRPPFRCKARLSSSRSSVDKLAWSSLYHQSTSHRSTLSRPVELLTEPGSIAVEVQPCFCPTISNTAETGTRHHNSLCLFVFP